MSKPTVTIRILNEVHMKIIGLHGDHHKVLYNKYAIFAPNYFFSPKFKLGQWDGKIRNYGADGKTFFYLVEEILPTIVQWGYDVNIDDRRQSVIVTPDPVTPDMFAHIAHPDTGKPIVLRDDQVDGVNALIRSGNGLCIAGTGAGKAQPLHAKVLTTDGWKTMGDMRINDQVITPSGRVASVTGVFPQPIRDIYTVTFHDGAKAQACAEHLWSVHMPARLSRSPIVPRVISTADMIDFLTAKKQGNIPGFISIPTVQPIAFSHKSLMLDPYALGVLLGAGRLVPSAPILVCHDASIVEKFQSILHDMGECVTFDNGTCSCTCPLTVPAADLSHKKHPLMKVIKDLGIFNIPTTATFIPARYKQASITQRMELLRGLLDAGGIVDAVGNISYTTASNTLAMDIREVVWSLGGICKISNPGTYVCTIMFSDPKQLFSSRAKLAACDKIKKFPTIHRRVVSVEKTSTERAQCIMVDDTEHLYITDNYTVTHNTLMCAALVTAYDQSNIRSLTIVPDQTLIRQTKQNYILVGLDTGEYSGTKKTLDHAHVVSTWQALKNNPKIILSFNMIIVDEAHGLRGNMLRGMITDQAASIPYRFGFTGTLPEDEAGKLQVHTALGPIRHVMPASDLIDMGVLADLHISIFQLEEDLHAEYTTFCEEECVTTKPPTYAEFKQNYFPDYSSEKDYRLRNKGRLQWIADCVELQRDSNKGNTLCLVDSIPTARALSKLVPNSYVVNGTDMADTNKRQAVYDLFGTRDDLVVIATVNVAGTGLSINRIFNLVLVDLGKSFIRIIQAIGRGLRKAHDKDFVNVIDICGDFKYSKAHMNKRIKYYQEAGYPYKKHKIPYSRDSNTPQT